jgi:hypothetical protein
MMTRNQTIDRIGAGLRREIGAIVQSPLPERMRELLARLEQLDRRTPPPAPAPCCGSA